MHKGGTATHDLGVADTRLFFTRDGGALVASDCQLNFLWYGSASPHIFSAATNKALFHSKAALVKEVSAGSAVAPCPVEK